MSGRTNVELEGITLLGNQQTKYPDDYAPERVRKLLQGSANLEF